MFEKNIAAIEKKNPKLAEKLKNHNVDDIKSIEVYESESKNFIISYNGVLLHSNEDPLREAKSIWYKTIIADLTDKDIQVVYGLGIGYLFKRAYVNASSRVFLYEPSLDILRFVLEHVDFSKELNDERVYISDDKEEFLKHFESKYLMGDKVEILFLPSYLHFEKENLLKLSKDIYNVVKDKGIDQKTIANNAKKALENITKRLPNLDKYTNIDALKDTCKGKSGMVLAAGPSLKDNIEKIKENQDKFITIAMTPILDILTENDIIPDFVIAVDAWEQTFKFPKSIDKLKSSNLVVEARADIGLDELNTNSKFVYFSNTDKISGLIIDEVEGIEQKNTVPSVVLLGYELANILGLNDATFVGVDLAILDNKAYADDTKTTIVDDTKMTIKKAGVYEQTRYITKIKSADGGEVITREDYLVFIKEFEKIAKSNNSLKMYNTSLKGAYIEGMDYKKIDEIVKEIQTEKPNIKEISTKATENNNICKELSRLSKDFLIEEKKSIKDQEKYLDNAIKGTEEVLKILSEKNPELEKFQKVFNENIDNFSNARQLITKDIMISTYMQSEIIDYLKKYNRDKDVNIEKLISNFKCDIDLFKYAKEVTSVIIALIDEVL